MTLAIIICFWLSAKGISIPTAISFRKNPTIIALTASAGRPNNPDTTDPNYTVLVLSNNGFYNNTDKTPVTVAAIQVVVE